MTTPTSVEAARAEFEARDAYLTESRAKLEHLNARPFKASTWDYDRVDIRRLEQVVDLAVYARAESRKRYEDAVRGAGEGGK